MAAQNTITTMAGLHKEVYGGDSDIDKVLPASAVLQDIIPFDQENKVGDSYHQAVVLTHENGFTYNGSGGSVVSLEAAVAATMKDASLSSVEKIGRAQLAYTAASRAAAQGKQAFKKATAQVLMNLRKAAVKRLELMLLYGKAGLGTVASLSSETVTFNAVGWSPTTWAGLEGAIVEFWTTAATGATEHGATTGSTVSSVDFANLAVTFASGGPSGGTPVDADDVAYFYGARGASSYNECDGLINIASNTGTLFGIDGSSYALWSGNTKSSFGTPTMGRFLDALTGPVEKGLDEGVVLLVPVKAWEVLNADLAANRMYDGSYSKAQATNGAQSIKYYGQMGEIEVRAHPYLRRGDAVAFPKSIMKRVGSAELGMGVPGTDGREVYFHMPEKNAVEMRTYTDQALFCGAPAQCVYISGITYP